ncbi:hypothetical protein JCGZ_18622 [Jatropha curcas]|uniref:Uncharacterized protein n=1 Tax=Jatropha curcas TaxID=180498 RepID=A0A067KDY8_JATCU|nr:hypothetical protein JCGZ_18622 [Jatropha curcas]
MAIHINKAAKMAHLIHQSRSWNTNQAGGSRHTHQKPPILTHLAPEAFLIWEGLAPLLGVYAIPIWCTPHLPMVPGPLIQRLSLFNNQ